MSTACVVLSDLHMVVGNNQDSFTRKANLVESFDRRLAQDVAQVDEFTLLLNGEVFDLWELVSTPDKLGDPPKADPAQR